MAKPVINTKVGKQALSTLNAKQQKLVKSAFGTPVADRTKQQKAAMKAYFTELNSIRHPNAPAASSGGGAKAGGGGKGGGGAEVWEPGDGKPPMAGVPDWVYHANVDDVIKDDSKMAWILNQAGFSGSLEDMKTQAMLAHTWAGRDQYALNVSGDWDAVKSNKALQNVSMNSDENMWRRIVGEAMDAYQQGEHASGPEELRKIWDERRAIADKYSWISTPETIQSLADQGVQWSTELFASPELNLTDPFQPLFGKGVHPNSLFGATGFQAGEEAMLAGMGADQLAAQIMPLLYQYYNRPAGSAPTGPGPMMGDLGGWGGEAARPFDPNYVPLDDYINAPGSSNLRKTDAYKQWQAWGYPGDPTQNGWVHDAGIGLTSSYNPLQGHGVPASGPNPWLFNALMSGQIKPEYFTDPNAFYDSIVPGALSGLVGQTAYLNDPSLWFQGQYEPYGNISPDQYSRYTALMNWYGLEDPLLTGAWAGGGTY